MSKLKEFIALENDGFSRRTLYGCNYFEISTGFADRIFIDYLMLNQGPITQIVELGTWKGVTSLHLGMSAKVMGVKFHTFDYVDVRPAKVKSAWLDNMYFYQEDILTLNKNLINLISKPNSLIFIDNGDKEKEFNQYVPYIGANSIIIIHDWNTEVFEENIQDTIEGNLLEPCNLDVAELLGTDCRAWRKL